MAGTHAASGEATAAWQQLGNFVGQLRRLRTRRPRLTSPRVRRERQVSVVSPKQANGVIRADKKSERSRANESGRREAVRSPQQSVTATSKQMRSTKRTGNSSVAAAAISSDSDADEIMEQRPSPSSCHDSLRSGRVKNGGGACHSTQRHVRAGAAENDKDHVRSRRYLTSPQRERHSSQEQPKSLSTPRRHGVRRSKSVDKRRDDDCQSPVHHRRSRKEAVQVNSDNDSASDDNGLLQSEQRHGVRDKRGDDSMEQLGAKFLEFLKLKSSPKSSTPRDKDGGGKHQERRTDESS